MINVIRNGDPRKPAGFFMIAAVVFGWIMLTSYGLGV